MANARRDKPQSLIDQIKGNPILNKLFIEVLLKNIDTAKCIEPRTYRDYKTYSRDFVEHLRLEVFKEKLKYDEKSGCSTTISKWDDREGKHKEVLLNSDQLFTECLKQALSAAGSYSPDSCHYSNFGFIQRIFEWLSFLYPPLYFPDQKTTPLRREILDELVTLAKLPYPYSTDGVLLSPSDSLSEEQQRISACHIARGLLRNIGDINTLRMLMNDRLNQDIITQAELKKETLLSENKDSIPLITASSLFKQDTSSPPIEYIHLILFLNKKLKVLEKIKEYKPPENRENTVRALQKNIINARTDEDIVNAFLEAMPDIEKDHGLRGTQGSTLYKKMQEAYKILIGKDINLLEEYRKRKSPPSAVPGSRPPGNAAASS